MFDKLLAAIRTEHGNRGLDEETLKKVATELAKTVTTDEAIAAAVAGVGPMLGIIQSEVDIRVKKAEKTTPPPTPAPAKVEESKKEEPKGDEAPSWFKNWSESIDKRLGTIEQGKTADTRTAQLEEVLQKVTPAFKQSIMGAFAFMNFADDNAFKTYLESVKTQSANFIQEEANKGLSGSHRPAAPGGTGDKTASKEEAEAIVNAIM